MSKTPKIKRDYAAERAAAEAQAAANNMAKNFKADLATENLATVLAGGSADETLTNEPMRKRRAQATGSLSSQLGINS